MICRWLRKCGEGFERRMQGGCVVIRFLCCLLSGGKLYVWTESGRRVAGVLSC